jgi:hypothetical protein
MVRMRDFESRHVGSTPTGATILKKVYIMKSALIVSWVERERGWGQRADGVTLHLTKAHADKFIEDYWATQSDYVPDEYTAPTTHKIVDVTDGFYKKLMLPKHVSAHGIRYWQHEWIRYREYILVDGVIKV